MKAQLSRFLSIFYTVAVVFVLAAALSTATVGCGDEDSGDDGDADSGTGAVDDDDSYPGTSGSGGSGDPVGSSEEGVTVGGDPSDSESDDDSTDGDAEDAEDSEDTDGDEPDDGTDGDEPDDGTDGDEPDDGTGGAGDRAECTPDDLSECADINITGGLLPMEVCCTEDGFCGRIFTLPDGFTTGCITEQFVDPPIVPECEDCARSSCQQEVSDCENDSACLTLSDCLKSCTDLMACAGCVIDNTAGLANYGTLAVCAVSECPVCVEQFGSLLPPELVDAIVNADIFGGGGMPGGGMPGGGF